MYNSVRIVLFLLLLMPIAACKQFHGGHFITDRQYRNEVEESFYEVRDMARHREKALFSVFDEQLSTREREALMFLYAYMPLNDLADRDGGFYLRNVRLAFEAEGYFPWGRDIPEDVFRHFVLPHRVNNEVLDTARGVFLSELKPRLVGLSLQEAVLEVNHWCHEKVSYEPTDSRTISPLAAIRTAYGRCGEESVFTVTALRSVGIPARQVYTPRWAHCDDNHAWVEVWVDGSWHFLGACEPEPALDMGWFAGPAMRAMMVHTNTYGRYHGSEKVLEEYRNFSRLNLLPGYASTKVLTVRIVDKDGVEVKGAHAHFGLYNYAEFYPLFSTISDDRGNVSFETGLGDLQVFATDGAGHFGLLALRPHDADTLELRLNSDLGDEFSMTGRWVPPVPKIPPASQPVDIGRNAERLLQEDSIRNAYIDGFPGKNAGIMAQGPVKDSERGSRLLVQSRGNWKVVSAILMSADTYGRELVLSFMESLAVKDLHDISEKVALDHLDVLSGQLSGRSNLSQIEKDYLVCPRVDLEELTPCRSLLLEQFSGMRTDSIRETMASLVRWVTDSITIWNESSPYNILITPTGVASLRMADPGSRDVFFVAAARALGVPARLEPGTRIPQYFDTSWHPVSFSGNEVMQEEGSAVLLLSAGSDAPADILYRVRFGLSRFDGERFVTLDYPWELPLNELSRLEGLPEGYYQLITGSRAEDGSVMTWQHFFRLQADTVMELVLEFPSNEYDLQKLFTWPEAGAVGTTAEIWIDPGTEPGRHFLTDMASVRQAFTTLGINFILHYRDPLEGSVITLFPQGTSFLDYDDGRLESFMDAAPPGAGDKGLLLSLYNERGEVYFFSAGYQIGAPSLLVRAAENLALGQ